MSDPQTSVAATSLKDFLPLIGVVIGGSLVTAGNEFREWRKGKRESRRLAYAFKAELNALKEIGDNRRYIEHLTAIAKTGRRPNDGSNVLTIREGREFFPIYRNNLAKIGLLKNPLPEKIVKYYAQATSVIEEIKSMSEGCWLNISDDTMSSHLEDIVSLMQNTRSLGSDIVQEIDRLYP